MGAGDEASVATSARDRLPSSSRYELLTRIASGGMATVYVGRLSGVVGFSRVVAIKRAHPHLLEDPAFKKMLIEEAQLASKIHHPNVVAVQNVEELEGELLLVMDYVEGAALSDLVAAAKPPAAPLPPGVVVRIILDTCAGLHAAHGVKDEDGRLLGLVHRDISPHNILVGIDGVARLADFGIAKSSSLTASGSQTATGALKGKVAYMAPEYIESGTTDRRGDIFALGIVAWEALTQRRLFRGANEVETLKLVMASEVPVPSTVAPSLGPGLDQVLLRALARSPTDRFQTALELSDALEAAARSEGLIASHGEVGKVVSALWGSKLEGRRELVRNRPLVPVPQDSVSAMVARHNEDTRDLVAAPEPVSAPTSGVKESAAALGGADAHERSTLGSGASSRHVAAARADAARTSPRRRIFMAAVVVAAVALGVAAQMKARSTRASSTPASATSPPAPESLATLPAASAIAPIAPPLVAEAPAEPLAVPAPAAPADSAKKKVTHPQKPPKKKTVPKDELTTPTPFDVPPPQADKAPPNPYNP